MRVNRQVVAARSAMRMLSLLSVFAAAGPTLSGQTTLSFADRACGAELTEDSAGCAITLVPSEARDLLVPVPPGKVRMLTAEQVQGAVELRLPDAATRSASSDTLQPFLNQAGLHSRIHILVRSGEQVAISNPSKVGVAAIVFTVGAAQPADANSELERTAEKAFAQAEMLRIQDTQDHATAIKAYDEAIASWQSAGNQPELARALVWKADFIVNNEGNAPLAPAVIERATPMLANLDPIEAAHYWLVLAFIHVVRGDYDATRDAYRRALALYEAVGDSAHQAKVLDNSARVELMEGHSDLALTDERRAVGLAAAAGDARRQAFVQEELAAIYSTAGDSESAYHAYGDALQALKRLPPEPRMEAAVWVGLSDLYLTLGDLGRAQDSLDQSTAIWKTTDFPIGMTDTLNNYGALYLVKGAPREARKYLERGLELAKRIDYERGSIALMSSIGDSYLYEHDAVHAEQVLDGALVRAKKAQQTDSEMRIHCHLGDLALLKHDLKEAVEQYATCSKQALAANDVYTRIQAEGGLARTALESGALDDGQTHCEQALGMIEATRGQLRNQDLKTSFFASQHAYYDLEIQILMRMGLSHPGEGYQWRAFLIAERARARTLLDQVTASSDVHAAASQALIAEHEDLQRRLRTLEAKQSGRGGSEESQSEISSRSAIARLTVTESQLHSEIANNGESESASSSALTLESLEGLLPDDHSVLMEYWAGESGSYAWSLTRGGIRSFRLPPAAVLDHQCASFRKALLATSARDPRVSAEESVRTQAAKEARWKQLGADLAITLFPRGALLPSTSTVLVVGDGAVETVPLAVLPGISTISGPDRRLRRIGFLNEPSASIFAFLEERSMNSRPVRLAVFTADPSSDSRSAGHGREMASYTGALASLPFTGNEADSIRKIFGADAVQTFPSASLSPSTMQNLDWQQFTIGHFAMHAVLNQKYAELTALSFGDSSGSQFNSKRLLWYGDIRNLHVPLELVVLSACNTALGAQVPGEGLRGLTQAFFAAGSQRVLGTLWEVDDQATSEWMGHFYQAMKQTHSPAKALQRTQLAMAADPQWNDPYYWAGFVLAGDWRPIP